MKMAPTFLRNVTSIQTSAAPRHGRLGPVPMLLEPHVNSAQSGVCRMTNTGAVHTHTHPHPMQTEHRRLDSRNVTGPRSLAP